MEEDIELKTEEVQDILSRTPRWIIRWGTLCLFGVVVVFFLISSFLKYPTIIPGTIKLTTSNQPIKVVNKVPGKIEKLYCSEGSDVHAMSKLAVIENPIPYQNIAFLRRMTTNVYSLLSDKATKIDSLDTRLSFGHLQSEYNNLVERIKDYEFFTRNEFYSSKVVFLQQQIDHYKSLEEVTLEQLKLSNQELGNYQVKYEADKALFNDKVIAKMDFIKTENDFIKQKREVENIKKYLTEARITRLEYVKQLNEMKFSLDQKQLEYIEAIRQSLKSIESSVSTWQQNYIVEAPISGKVFFLKNIVEKQFLNSNEELFVIVPHDQSYICLMDVSAAGFGKIKEGQKVRIKLDNYPYHEYGQLIGKVQYVPKVPFQEKLTTNNSSNYVLYRVLVELDKDNRTTYNKALSFSPEMTGTGEVMTDELTLFKRFINRVRGDMDNHFSE